MDLDYALESTSLNNYLMAVSYLVDFFKYQPTGTCDRIRRRYGNNMENIAELLNNLMSQEMSRNCVKPCADL